MNAQGRAALLGVLVGIAHTVVRLFGSQSVGTTPGTPSSSLVLTALVATVLSLAVIPGLPLYGAWNASVDSASSVTRLAAVVGVGTGIAVVVSYPVLTALVVDAPFAEALQIRLFGPYLVNGLGPAVHSGVGALAGFLLSARSE